MKSIHTSIFNIHRRTVYFVLLTTSTLLSMFSIKIPYNSHISNRIGMPHAAIRSPIESLFRVRVAVKLAHTGRRAFECPTVTATVPTASVDFVCYSRASCLRGGIGTCSWCQWSCTVITHCNASANKLNESNEFHYISGSNEKCNLFS